MAAQYDLLKILSDGNFHSGTVLGKALGVSRTAIWKTIKRLQKQLRIQIHSVRGRGYRLENPVELLDASIIRDNLKKEEVLGRVNSLDIQFVTISTNQCLIEKIAQGASSGCVCMAEQQTSGRGRRGRIWASPFGGNIYLSLLWRFESGVGELTGLSLAIAVAIVRTLYKYGVNDAKVKWPNDILWHDRKLCGILLEMRGEAMGPCIVVIGVGLNICMPHEASEMIDQPWVDLQSILGGQVARNALAANLISDLVLAVITFQQQGLIAFLPEWRSMDHICGHPVQVNLADQTFSGIAMGVDETGALLVEHNGNQKRYLAGDVSLRPSTHM